jgi:hypothetical protein
LSILFTFKQFFPDHGFSTIGAFYCGAFYALLMWFFMSTFGTHTKAASPETATFVSSLASTFAQAPSRPWCIISLRIHFSITLKELKQ